MGNNVIYISYETLVTKRNRGRTSLPFVKLSFTVYANENTICSFPDLSKVESHCCMLEMTHFKVHMHPSRKHEQGMGVGCPNPPLLFPLYLHIIDYHKPNYHFFQSQTSGLGRPKIPLEYKLQQNCYCCNSLYFIEIFTSSNMLSAVRIFLLVFNYIVQFSHCFQFLSYSHFRIIQVTGNREIRAKTFSPI